jgi:hypothetical protein
MFANPFPGHFVDFEVFLDVLILFICPISFGLVFGSSVSTITHFLVPPWQFLADLSPIIVKKISVLF